MHLTLNIYFQLIMKVSRGKWLLMLLIVKKDVEKVCRQYVLSTACLSLGLLGALGAICFLIAIPLSKNMWLGIPLLLCFVLAVLGCYLADKVEPSG